MDDKNFKILLNRADNFELRRAVERLREGLFDSLGVRMLTAGEEKLDRIFARGVYALEKGDSHYQCIAGAYGQGKSHSLNFIKQRALEQGFVVSYINLDPRQVPFHDFKNVYRALMAGMTFPKGDDSFVVVWKTAAKNWLSMPQNRGKTLLDLIPTRIPHRFKCVLFALAQKNMSIPIKKRQLKKHVRFKPREFSWILKNVLMGKDIPAWRMSAALYYRQVPFYKENSLVCKRPDQYFDMILGMAELFQKIGFKGWVLLFDEGESIMQARITSRSKSYALLHKIFYPQEVTIGFYPVFAFTHDFFTHLQDEAYDRKPPKSEIPYFEKNYNTAWKNINIHKLHDLSLNEWKTLIKRLLLIHANAYLWQPPAESIQKQMNRSLTKYNGVEPRLKLKLLVNHLDLVQQKMIVES